MNSSKLMKYRSQQQLIDTLAKGGGEAEILASMLPYIQGFKGIMDNAAAGEMEMLASQYDGFRRFAKLLKKLAGVFRMELLRYHSKLSL